MYHSPIQGSNEQKKTFAVLILKSPYEPFACAKKIFPHADDVGICAFVANNWVNDPIVVLYKHQLLESGEHDPSALSFTKNDLIKGLWVGFNKDCMTPDELINRAEVLDKIMD